VSCFRRSTNFEVFFQTFEAGFVFREKKDIQNCYLFLKKEWFVSTPVAAPPPWVAGHRAGDLKKMKIFMIFIRFFQKLEREGEDVCVLEREGEDLHVISLTGPLFVS